MDIPEDLEPMETPESSVLPEAEAYVYLLTVLLLVDKKLYEEVCALTRSSVLPLGSLVRGGVGRFE